jgi:hypothetical protein
MTRSSDASAEPANVNTAKSVARFRQAAADYTQKATASKAAARETLISLGIYTPSGKLSKNYK